MEIRPATVADAPSIARTHATVWRRTYRELAPPEAIAALDEASRRARWVELLSHPAPGQAALVAGIDGRLAGFGLAGPAVHPAFGGRAEIRYLYVDDAFQRRGVGRRLMAELAAGLAATGRKAVALGVVEGNAPAIAFYAAMGGRAVGTYTDPGPIWRSSNIVYAWDDITVLCGRGAA
ncbi:MAG: GNAT family N-acetyltransferase [Alphaproteobacteria bacterium]|nr:GNAT family N-acetyltransferase [Alphaproteobacteria bacterium]